MYLCGAFRPVVINHHTRHTEKCNLNHILFMYQNILIMNISYDNRTSTEDV